MRHFLAVMSLAFAGAFVLASMATACGDKYLVPGRGPAFCSTGKSLRLLIVENDASPAAKVVMSSRMLKTLKQVGYQVVTCDRVAQCATAAREGSVDIVLADVTDAGQIRASDGSRSARLAIVPVLLKPTRAEMEQARADYGQAYDAAGGELRLLEVLARTSRTLL